VNLSINVKTEASIQLTAMLFWPCADLYHLKGDFKHMG